jgi:hypothetical protein
MTFSGFYSLPPFVFLLLGFERFVYWLLKDMYDCHNISQFFKY